jgi:hypothetical protein
MQTGTNFFDPYNYNYIWTLPNEVIVGTFAVTRGAAAELPGQDAATRWSH